MSRFIKEEDVRLLMDAFLPHQGNTVHMPKTEEEFRELHRDWVKKQPRERGQYIEEEYVAKVNAAFTTVIENLYRNPDFENPEFGRAGGGRGRSYRSDEDVTLSGGGGVLMAIVIGVSVGLIFKKRSAKKN